MTGIQPDGLPHSEIPGSTVTCTYPGRFVACHVLLRLREPRHPPRALVLFISLAGITSRLFLFYIFFSFVSCPVTGQDSTREFRYSLTSIMSKNFHRRHRQLDGFQGTIPVVTPSRGPVIYIESERKDRREATFLLVRLQKGGVPAAPSGTATLLRLSPSYRYYPSSLLAVTIFRYSRLPWLDGRCVQGPGTYSPRHG